MVEHSFRKAEVEGSSPSIGCYRGRVYGKVRFTQDADIAVAPFGDEAGQLYDVLKKAFYISKDAMDQAISDRGSFNII